MYTLIKKMQWKGEVWLIKVGSDYFAVSRADTFDKGDETMIFASSEDGEAIIFEDLYVGYGEDHETAIKNWLT